MIQLVLALLATFAIINVNAAPPTNPRGGNLTATGTAAVSTDSAEPMLAITAADLDLESSRTFQNGKADAPPSASLLRRLLGIESGGEPAPWSAGQAEATFQYLLVFRQPVAIGSMLVCGAGPLTVASLKPDVTGAADPAVSSQWAAVAIPAHQSGGQMLTFPPEFKTRALLCTEARTYGRSEISLWRLFRQRWHNLTPSAIANAESEFTVYPDMGSPFTQYARHITEGAGYWQNSGPGKDKHIHRPPISDVAPSWFTLTWEEPQRLGGLLLVDNFQKFELATYQGPPGVNPAVAAEREWTPLPEFPQRRSAAGHLLFFPPVQARGLRVKILSTTPSTEAKISGFQVFTDLADGPVPEVVKVADAPAFSIPFTVPADGEIAMVVEDAAGRRVRNLVGRSPRPQGPTAVAWDLKDETGHYVPPGVFTWKALWHPPLQLRYQMTPYPNIEANTTNNSPWLNGASGPGGWLADHSGVCAVAPCGPRVYLSAPCAESGIALIECDLAGRKLWGHPNFAAWTGPSLLAADGTAVYGVAPPNLATGGTEYLWRVDPQTKQVATLLAMHSSSQRCRGIVGLAAHAGQVYCAVHGPDNWLDNAATGADVDIDHCVPLYRAKPEHGDRYASNLRTDFLRLFRLTGTPPGNGDGLITLDSTSFARSQNHIVLTFKHEVAIGSLVLPLPEQEMRFEISVRKAGSPGVPDPFHEAEWTSVWKGMPAARNDRWWSVIPLPENTTTRAVRLSFRKGTDEFDDMLVNDDPDKELGGTAKAAAGKPWKMSLEGVKLLRRRFESLLPAATVRVSSGQVNAQGEWDAARTQPISEIDPGIYALEWPQPQPVRGLAIKEIDGQRTLIDVFEGPGAVDIKATNGWRQVAAYEQPLRDYYQPDENHNSRARFMDGYVDFGEEISTKAVRLRVVKQWSTKDHHPSGVRNDRGGQTLDLRRCRIYGVAPMRYLGGEPPVDSLAATRLEVVDGATGQIAKELPLARPGKLACGAAGELFCLSAGKLIQIDRQGGQAKDIITDLVKPTAIATDQDSALYVFDAGAARQVVRVYDRTGKFLRSIGTPGGFQPGPWDPTRLGAVSDLAVDETGQLWVVENSYTPKRVTVWTAATGAFKKELLGNTAYGGGGVLDPDDKTRLFYAMPGATAEFAIDWETGATKLKNWFPCAARAGEVPVQVNGHTYLVTRTEFGRQQAGVVYLYEKGQMRCVAAVGAVNGFPPLQTPAILASLGGQSPADLQFIWSDANGDGKPQVDEVTFHPKQPGEVAWFDRTLGVQAGSVRYEVKEFRADGTPVYVEKPAGALPNAPGVQFADGSTFFFRSGSERSRSANAVYGTNGVERWEWATEGYGVHALYSAKSYREDQVVSEFDVVGVAKAHAGDLGEFCVTTDNVGCWNIWSSDGLLVGRLFRDIRDPRRQAWSMRDHQRGLRLDDVTVGQEHFSGYFCRTADNHYYAVAGHNHISVIEVTGLEQCRRSQGQLTITPETLVKTQEWERNRQRRLSYESAKVITCPPLGSRTITIDGDDSDWPNGGATIDLNPSQPSENPDLTLRMFVDPQRLYLCYRVRNHGPMKNTGNDWHTYYKTGACVDLQLGVDPAAAANRRNPVSGDQRLLLTVVNGKPAAVLYRSVVPGAPRDQTWEISTGVAKTSFDQVERVTDAELVCRETDNGSGYIYEAAIPLARLGLKPEPGLRLKLDWGILESGRDGTEVLQRIYWSNKATALISDVAEEATLHPDLWGWVLFAETGHEQKMMDARDPLAPAQDFKQIDDLLGR